MPRVLKRPQAETDLDNLWLYIARDSPDTADLFLEKIEKKCQSLAVSPGMGISRDELRPCLRSLTVGNYLIFYLPIEDGIDVVRVLQAMRDIEELI